MGGAMLSGGNGCFRNRSAIADASFAVAGTSFVAIAIPIAPTATHTASGISMRVSRHYTHARRVHPQGLVQTALA